MGSILLGIIGALVAVPIGAAVYRVLKYLTNRDPEHALPGHEPPDPDPPATVAATSGTAPTNGATTANGATTTNGAATSQG
jgi:hypothetical protein